MGAQASADTKAYRDGYPNLENNLAKRKNLEFYMNERPSEPDGDLIEDILANWKGDYRRLEHHHGYIQWLFPIKEKGMNSLSQRLHEHEAVAIRASPEARARLVRAYELMLDFYGMRLADAETGAIERNPMNWEKRYKNLNTSAHNFLRITRILKCLGELGFEHYKMPFLRHIVIEIEEHNQLGRAAQSCENYWIPVLRDQAEREQMGELAQELASRRPVRTGRRKTSPETAAVAAAIIASAQEAQQPPPSIEPSALAGAPAAEAVASEVDALAVHVEPEPLTAGPAVLSTPTLATPVPFQQTPLEAVFDDFDDADVAAETEPMDFSSADAI